MTKEEILVMEAGKKLDILIAENVFGWIKNDIGFDVWYNGNTYTSAIFDYSTNILAAWDVVEKLQPKLWVRMNVMMDDNYCGIGSPDMLWEYRSKSMPECICKAALLAVMDS